MGRQGIQDPESSTRPISAGEIGSFPVTGRSSRSPRQVRPFAHYPPADRAASDAAVKQHIPLRTAGILRGRVSHAKGTLAITVWQGKAPWQLDCFPGPRFKCLFQASLIQFSGIRDVLTPSMQRAWKRSVPSASMTSVVQCAGRVVQPTRRGLQPKHRHHIRAPTSLVSKLALTERLTGSVNGVRGRRPSWLGESACIGHMGGKQG